jgi:hypothetical protein
VPRFITCSRYRRSGARDQALQGTPPVLLILAPELEALREVTRGSSFRQAKELKASNHNVTKEAKTLQHLERRPDPLPTAAGYCRQIDGSHDGAGITGKEAEQPSALKLAQASLNQILELAVLCFSRIGYLHFRIRHWTHTTITSQFEPIRKYTTRELTFE